MTRLECRACSTLHTGLAREWMNCMNVIAGKPCPGVVVDVAKLVGAAAQAWDGARWLCAVLAAATQGR